MAVSDLPMLHDMDANYSPQYVKLARILRDKITCGEYKHGGHALPTGLAVTLREYNSALLAACASEKWARTGHPSRYGRLATSSGSR